MEGFEGKTAVVIGGTGGIGLEIVNMLLFNGACVIIHGRDKKKLDDLSLKLEKKYPQRVKTVQFDFYKENFLDIEKSLLNQNVKKADILCVCFGPFLQKELEHMDAQEWHKVSVLNYALPGLLISSCLENMKAHRWGRILLFGGTGTNFRTEFLTNTAYAGAKSGLGVLVQSVAAYYAVYGITCNCIMPGFTDTEYVDSEKKQLLKQKMPDKRLIQTKSIADAARFLLENADLNGVLLKIDKGWSPCVLR